MDMVQLFFSLLCLLHVAGRFHLKSKPIVVIYVQTKPTSTWHLGLGLDRHTVWHNVHISISAIRIKSVFDMYRDLSNAIIHHCQSGDTVYTY